MSVPDERKLNHENGYCDDCGGLLRFDGACENPDCGMCSSSGVAGGYAAEKLKPEQKVWVECNQYEGPGTVSTDTRYGSHLVHLGKDHAGEDRGLYVAVRLSNGNTHLYPADTVQPAEREAA